MIYLLLIFHSLSQKLDSLGQTAEFQSTQSQVVWKINKLPGKAETVAQFRVGLRGETFIRHIMHMLKC